MRKTKLLTLIVSLFLLLPIVYADCTEEEINHFKEIEDEYKVTYEFNEDTKDYTVTFYNSEPNKYIYFWISETLDTICNYNDKKYICENVPMDEYDIGIAGITETCNEILKIDNLNLSSYNQYAFDPLCEGIEDFVLCNPLYDKEISREEFVSRVETYKKTIQKEQNNIRDRDTEISEKKIIEYIQDNLFQIIIVVVFIILVIVTIALTAKSIRQSRRLE